MNALPGAMRVLFLDFDGVLNSSWDLQVDGRSFSTEELAVAESLLPFIEGPGYAHKIALDLRTLDRSAVERLNRIVELTGVKVVVSSSWRKTYTVEGLRRILAHVGFRGEVIDRTPVLPRVLEGKYSVEAPRGAEIAMWLSSQFQSVEYVILDDDTDMMEVAHRHVKTALSVGLTDANVGAVLTLFGVTPPLADTQGPEQLDPIQQG